MSNSSKGFQNRSTDSGSEQKYLLQTDQDIDIRFNDSYAFDCLFIFIMFIYQLIIILCPFHHHTNKYYLAHIFKYFVRYVDRVGTTCIITKHLTLPYLIQIRNFMLKNPKATSPFFILTLSGVCYHFPGTYNIRMYCKSTYPYV